MRKYFVVIKKLNGRIAVIVTNGYKTREEAETALEEQRVLLVDALCEDEYLTISRR